MSVSCRALLLRDTWWHVLSLSSLTHSLTRSLNQSLTRSLTHSLTHSLAFSSFSPFLSSFCFCLHRSFVRLLTFRATLFVVRCDAVRCGVVWCGAVLCCAVWCGVVLCGGVRCAMVRCSDSIAVGENKLVSIMWVKDELVPANDERLHPVQHNIEICVPSGLQPHEGVSPLLSFHFVC